MVRTWVYALAVFLSALTVAPAVFHVEHGGADLDCEICELTTESLADLSDQQLQAGPPNAPEALLKASKAAPVLSYHGPRTPARAPPLSVFPLL